MACAVRQAGRHFDKYRSAHKHKHTFWIKEVPGFEYIMIHIGNDAAESLGCPFVGLTTSLKKSGDWNVLRSKEAYCEQVYPLLTQLTEPGERLFITIERSL